MSCLNDELEERQLLVRSSDGSTVLSMEDLTDSPTSSGFVSGSLEADLAVTPDLEDAEAIAHRRYEELSRRAQDEDLTEMEESNCIYQAGYDKQGRAVIVFIGKWFKYSQVDLDKALLYLLKVVEPVSSHDYVVFYFHTRTSRDNIPSYSWLKEVYQTLTYDYKKNLKAFYIVHPTIFTKMTCWWFATFMAPSIKNKIVNVRALEELDSVVDQKILTIPMFIQEQDMTWHGLRYFEP